MNQVNNCRRKQRNSQVPISAAILIALLCTQWPAATGAFAQATPVNQSYVVTEETRTLCDVGIFLYGDCSAYQKIAKWNGLKPPYLIRIGQKLTLLSAPTLTPNQGQAKLLEVWQLRMGTRKPGAEPLAEPKIPLEKQSYEDLVAQMPQPSRQALAETLKKEGSFSEYSPEVAGKLKAETRVTLAEDEMAEGELLFQQGKYSAALAAFQRARTTSPKLLPAWCYELQSRQKLEQKKEEIDPFISLFLKEHPYVKGLPFIGSQTQPGSTKK